VGQHLQQAIEIVGDALGLRVGLRAGHRLAEH
jgi:hypothetical protein